MPQMDGWRLFVTYLIKPRKQLKRIRAQASSTNELHNSRLALETQFFVVERTDQHIL